MKSLNNSGRLDGIEAARGIAALAVVLYHVARHINKTYDLNQKYTAFQFGHSGVDLFFAISGFIITYVHYYDIGNSAEIKQYAFKRFIRIMPNYWIALFLTVTMAVAGGHIFPNSTELFWSITLLPSHHEPILGVAWTLKYEVMFYIIFSILIINSRAGLILIMAWGAIVLLFNTIITKSAIPDTVYGFYNYEFMLGMAAGFWLRKSQCPRPGIVLILSTILFSATATLENYHIVDGYANFARILYGIPSTLIILSVAELSRLGKIDSIPRFLRILGRSSYSIYLYQFIFIGALWKIFYTTGVWHSIPPSMMFLVLVGAAVLGGIMASKYIEYPLMSLLRRKIAPLLQKS